MRRGGGITQKRLDRSRRQPWRNPTAAAAATPLSELRSVMEPEATLLQLKDTAEYSASCRYSCAPGARLALHRARRSALRGDDRRRELPRQRPRRERGEAEEADEHACLLRRHPCAPDPAPAESLEQALEFIRDDEAVEVTPKSIRLRKVELSAGKRQTAASRRKRDAAPA